jgi:hypothetical protein
MYNRGMKRRPSLKGRTRSSDAANSVDLYRSAALEPARAPRRKQIERVDRGVVDGPEAWDWDDSAVDLVGQQPRR